MKIIIYSIQDFERSYLQRANKMNHELTCAEEALNVKTTDLAQGHEAAVVFTGDDVSTGVVEKLHEAGIKYIAVRAVGYDNVDIKKANELGIKVASVPEYSPYAITEYLAALILAQNRKLILGKDIRFVNQFLNFEKRKKIRRANETRNYFNGVVVEIKNIDEFLLSGPTGIKTELEKVIWNETTYSLVIRAVETADSMADKQIAAWLKNY